MTRPTLSELLGCDARILSVALDDGIPDGNDPASNVRWHQIALEGEWDGHWQGAFSLSRRDFEQMAQTFRSLRTDVVVDYGHGTLFQLFNAQNGRAAGWIDELQLRQDDGGASTLHARISWTSAAAQAIREREFRYLSPTIVWKTPDRKTGADMGASIQSVALTNVPFLDELPEVTLNSIGLGMAATSRPQTGAMNMLSKDQWAELSQLVGLSADADPQKVLEACKQRDPSKSALQRVCSELGLAETTSPDELARAVLALKATAASAPSRDEFDRLVGELRATQAESALEQATREGKIVAQNKEWAQRLAATDIEGFRAWAASAPPVVPMGRVSHGSGPAPLSTVKDEPSPEQVAALAARLPDSERAAVTSMGLKVESYCKSNYAELVGLYG